MDNLPLELEKAVEKHTRDQERIVKQDGWGTTTQGLALAGRIVPALVVEINNHLSNPHSANPYERTLKAILRDLPPEVLAWAIVSTVIHGVATQRSMRKVLLLVGENFQHEAWAAGLTEDKPGVAKKAQKWAKAKYQNRQARISVAKVLAEANAYKGKEWSNELRLRAGAWGFDRLLQVAGDMFTVEHKADDVHVINITTEALAVMDKAVAEAIDNRTVWLPLKEQPKPWDWSHGGGVWDRRLPTISLVRSIYKDTQACVRVSIKDKSLKPALDALNSLQNVGWMINQPVLRVLKEVWDRGIKVARVPRKEELPLPDDANWKDMTQKERALWRRQFVETRLANQQIRGDHVGFLEDLETASRLDRFWTPMNFDWRGRVYGIPHFNFQRDDRVRALFLFAEGKPIGERGLYWLKVHLANCGEFDDIHKRPFDERVSWVNRHIASIHAIAEDPFNHRYANLDWTKADKPFLFLAACMELRAALLAGPCFITRLPVSFDGSCSGLQHLCAMTRAAEGHLVNLTPAEGKTDIYQVVADQARARIENDNDPLHQEQRRRCLEYGIDRKVVKRNVMTYAYSSKKFGMTEQQMEDLMDALALEVLEGKREEHPFSMMIKDKETGKERLDGGFQCAKYLAHHVYGAIEDVVKRPAEAMAFLQKLAKAAAHEGKPLQWKSPIGLPWINRYHEPQTKRVRLYMQDRCFNLKLATGNNKEIDKDRVANGVSPNFVHALDASHLLLTVNAAVAKGIKQIATVHDSFGCLAPDADEFRPTILEEFVRMYEEHDPLSEVLQQAKCDLTQHTWDRLPPVPERGPLNIREVLNADFAFA